MPLEKKEARHPSHFLLIFLFCGAPLHPSHVGGFCEPTDLPFSTTMQHDSFNEPLHNSDRHT
jgi:hypothetical protein